MVSKGDIILVFLPSLFLYSTLFSPPHPTPPHPFPFSLIFRQAPAYRRWLLIFSFQHCIMAQDGPGQRVQKGFLVGGSRLLLLKLSLG